MRCGIGLIIAILLLSGCSTAPGIMDMQNAEGERTTVLIVNPISDQYPESVRLWSEYVLSKNPDADIKAVTGDMTKEEVIEAVMETEGDRIVLIYHGHGGDGYAWLKSGEELPYPEILSLLVSKDVPFLLLVDACYSGSAAEGFKEIIEGYPHDAVLITSSSSEERSYGSIKGNPDGSASWIQRSLLLFNEIPSEVGTEEERQHPEVWIYEPETEMTEKMELPEPHSKGFDREYKALL